MKVRKVLGARSCCRAHGSDKCLTRPSRPDRHCDSAYPSRMRLGRIYSVKTLGMLDEKNGSQNEGDQPKELECKKVRKEKE